MVETRFGTWEELLDLAEPAVRPLLLAARDLVLSVHPDACEVVRLGDRAATFGIGPKKNTEGACYVLPYKAHVNLGFFRGAGLPDPSGLQEGTGAQMRHVKIRSLQQLQAPALRALIEASVAERKAALGR